MTEQEIKDKIAKVQMIYSDDGVVVNLGYNVYVLVDSDGDAKYINYFKDGIEIEEEPCYILEVDENVIVLTSSCVDENGKYKIGSKIKSVKTGKDIFVTNLHISMVGDLIYEDMSQSWACRILSKKGKRLMQISRLYFLEIEKTSVEGYYIFKYNETNNKFTDKRHELVYYDKEKDILYLIFNDRRHRICDMGKGKFLKEDWAIREIGKGILMFIDKNNGLNSYTYDLNTGCRME